MRIGHVHLKVRDLERSEQYYKVLLGASETDRVNGVFSFLTLGQAHHDIALQEVGADAPLPEQGGVGLYHTAFEVDSAAELLKATNTLEALNTGYSLVDHGISWALYTADPDGNGVEIFLDRRQAESGVSSWNGRSSRLSKAQIESQCQNVTGASV